MRAISAPSSSISNDASRTAEAVAFDLIGEAKHVLIVGDSAATLPAMLEASEHELTFVLSSAVHSDEARVYSSHVEVADLSAVTLSEILPGRQFDAVVIDAGGAPLPNLIPLLDDARNLLVNRGPLVALLPSATHGAVRLALLKGVIADALDNVAPQEIDRFTLERVFRTFLEANYDVESIERASHAIFEPSNLLPPIDRAGVSEAMVREIGTDPDAFTLQFIVKARPFAGINGQRSATLAQILAAADAGKRAAEQRAFAAEAQLVKEQPQGPVALPEPASPVHATALEAELEGTRHQAALNAAAAARGQLEIERMESRIAELELQVGEHQATTQRQSAEIEEYEARRADMVARIGELEEGLAAAGVTAAVELTDRTRDMVARIGQMEDLLAAAHAETAKANTRTDAARAGLQRRLTYVAQLTSLNSATAEKLRRSEAAIRALETEVTRAHRVAKGSASEVKQLHSELKQKNEQIQAMGAALSRRSRIVAKLETVRIALQDQLERVSGALAERSARISKLEAAETAATLELWLVRTAFKARISDLEKRARGALATERAHSANLEETLRHANDELTSAAAEKHRLQREAEQSVEDLERLRSDLRILQERIQSVNAQHELEIAEMHRSIDGLHSELATAKAANAEIPILKVRAIASEKRFEMHEALLLEMTKRARGLEDDVLAAVSRELQLQRDLANVGEHAKRVESDLHESAHRVAGLEHELEQAAHRAAHQEGQLTEAVECVAVLEPQLHELTDRTKRLEADALEAANREDGLRHQLSQNGDRAKQLETDLQRLSLRASQLEEELQGATARLQEQDELLQAADRRYCEQTAELNQAAEESVRQDERLAEQSARSEQLEGKLAETAQQRDALNSELMIALERCMHLDCEIASLQSSRAWKIANALRSFLMPWKKAGETRGDH